jgi:hypothetical protein
MDFDAVVERNGRVLIFETKADGVEICRGQQITLTRMWEKGATIFVISGKTPKTITGLQTYWDGSYAEGRMVGDRFPTVCQWDDVLFQVRRWYCRADGVDAPTREEWDRQLWLWDHDRHSPPDKK